MFTVVFLCLSSGVSCGVGGVCVSIGVVPGTGVGARGCISAGVYVVGEHPDSINEDETETAAFQDLATARLPASCQDSLVGSHDKIEVRRITPS